MVMQNVSKQALPPADSSLVAPYLTDPVPGNGRVAAVAAAPAHFAGQAATASAAVVVVPVPEAGDAGVAEALAGRGALAGRAALSPNLQQLANTLASAC